MSLPLSNNQEDRELCQIQLHRLTMALLEKQFTSFGLTQTLHRFVPQKANRLSINPYNHAIARYMNGTVFKDDKKTNPQLFEKLFIKSQYVFFINCMNK